MGEGRGGSGAAGPAAIRAPDPARGRSRWRGRRRRRSRKPWSRNRRANGQAPHARRAALRIPLFGRACGLVVRPDAGAIEERHPALGPAMPLRRLQQAFPGAQARPAAEGLRRHPPRAQLGRDLAPLRAVVVPPDDRLDGAAQVVWSVLYGGRHAAISGASTSHCASVRTFSLSRSAIPSRWNSTQGLTGPSTTVALTPQVDVCRHFYTQSETELARV